MELKGQCPLSRWVARTTIVVRSSPYDRRGGFLIKNSLRLYMSTTTTILSCNYIEWKVHKNNFLFIGRHNFLDNENFWSLYCVDFKYGSDRMKINFFYKNIGLIFWHTYIHSSGSNIVISTKITPLMENIHKWKPNLVNIYLVVLRYFEFNSC